jgi:hypothetical protein
MVVFFDNQGIAKILTEFSNPELQDLRIKENWAFEKAQYFSN